ncbi:MAG: hypothetical protein K1X78_13345 [Verrucomicrobiaceae bacterium]|nr:hypothetical protein [Verrucomicrobiaceae bacterium]
MPASVARPKPAADFQLGGKRKRGGRLVAALAAVLLIGGLGVACWMFQEPLKELAARYFHSKKEIAPEPSADTEKSASSATQASTAQVPKSEEPSGGKSPQVFDPRDKNAQEKPATEETPAVKMSAGSGGPLNPPAAGQGRQSVPPGFSPSKPPGSDEPPAEVKPGTSPGTVVMPAVPRATIVEDDGTDAALMRAPSRSQPSPFPPPAVEPSAPAITAVPTSSEPLSTPPIETIGGLQEMKPEAAPAAAALKSFFAAKSLKERLPHTLGAAAIQPLMERYYAKTDPGAIAVDEVQFLRYDPTPETGGGAHCVFSVASKLWQYPIPVMLQKEGTVFKVDWLAFVEFRDDLLKQFLSGYHDMPAQFHVGIRRTHYFDDDVPDLESKDCFEIQPPYPSYVGFVFVPKGTPLASDLAKRISWETVASYVIVELRWKTLGEMKWVELADVPQLNWYSYQAAAKPAAAPAGGGGSQKPAGGKDIKKPRKKVE